MARTIELSFSGETVRCAMEKVDRTSLYGSTEIETRDIDGSLCKLATLANDGRTLIPGGGTATAYMSSDGRWLDRSALVAVDASNNRLNTVPSSFSQPLELAFETTPSRFLDHAIRLAYALEPVDSTLPAKLSAALDKGVIYKTDFSYRGGPSANPAFVMRGADGTVWLLVGEENEIDFIGFEQPIGLTEEGDEVASEDDIDFDMM